MNTPFNKENAELLIHKAINEVELIDVKNCFVPRAKAIVITKLEEALLWLNYKGRSSKSECNLNEGE